MEKDSFQPSKKHRGPWWDPEGILAQYAPLTARQIARLPEPTRLPTQIWKVPALVSRMLVLYDAMMEVIATMTQDEEIPWNNHAMRDFLRESALGEHPPNPFRYKILTSFLRVCENRVRQEVAHMPALNCERDQEVMYRRLPRPILDAVWEAVEKTPLSPISREDLPLLPVGSKISNRLREDLIISELSTEEVLEVLNEEDEGSALHLLLRHAIVRRGDPDLLLLRTVLSWRNRKHYRIGQIRMAFQNMVIPERLNDLMEILNRPWMYEVVDHQWATKLLAEVKDLQFPRTKKLQLSAEKIEESRRNLEATVSLVNAAVEPTAEALDFSSEGGNPPETKTPPPPEKKGSPPVNALTSEEAERHLLDHLAEEGSLLRSALEPWAEERGKPLTSLVSQINERYFDELGAQLLFWEDDRLTMDPLDAEWWKERRAQ